MKEYIFVVHEKTPDAIGLSVGHIRRNCKELIRCKDCKHWYCYGDETFCSELGIYDTNKESYCSYAKREEK